MAGADAGGGSGVLASLIDKYGTALYRDLLFFYGIDLCETIEGSGVAPALVLGLVRGLPDDSMCHAREAGGDHLLGWGTDRSMMANLYNLVTLQTTATGNWKKRPKLPTIEQPKPPKDSVKKKKVSLMDLHARFQGALTR